MDRFGCGTAAATQPPVYSRGALCPHSQDNLERQVAQLTDDQRLMLCTWCAKRGRQKAYPYQLHKRIAIGVKRAHSQANALHSPVRT